MWRTASIPLLHVVQPEIECRIILADVEILRQEIAPEARRGATQKPAETQQIDLFRIGVGALLFDAEIALRRERRKEPGRLAVAGEKLYRRKPHSGARL